MLTINDLYERETKEIQEIEEKYNNLKIELQNNCTHRYKNGESALKYYIDDDDLDGWREPTFDEYNICEICGLYINL